jgi:phosphoribosyl 1,2-cyclic phosphodiesterase
MTGSRITVYGPKVLPNGIEGALDSQMHGAFFPLDFKSLPAIVEFRDIDNSVVNLESVTIRSTFLTHPNLSLGYRIESDSGTMVYATDWEPFTRFCVTAPDVNAVWRSTNLARAIVADEAMVEFCKGAGLLVCDAQYDSEEYSSRRGWGHSCVDDIVQLGLNAGVRRLALFHHDPMHDDLTIDRMVAKCRLQVRSARRRMAVFGARERVTVSLSH